MFFRGVDARGRHGVRSTVLLGVLLLVLGAAGYLTGAQGSGMPRCERYAVASDVRWDRVTGQGRTVVVVGDSWSVGLGLARPVESWPAQLAGRVHVAGFSGSGFSAAASDCGRRFAFDRRARRTLAADPDLVVVQGGLNDFNQDDAQVRAGFARLMHVLGAGHAPYDVVVVGPAQAPARAPWVPHLDRLLAALAAEHGVGYVSTRDLQLPYRDDSLHLTRAGHRIFGEAVADRISRLSLG